MIAKIATKMKLSLLNNLNKKDQCGFCNEMSKQS